MDLWSPAQVSHHPPISAGHAENDKWVYDIVSAPSTKFLGNSVEIYPVGARLCWLGCPVRHFILGRESEQRHRQLATGPLYQPDRWRGIVS